MSRFVQVDRDTAYLLPPSVQEWLPDHLARYVVDVVVALDLSELVRTGACRLGNNQERLSMRSHRPFMMASPTGC